MTKLEFIIALNEKLSALPKDEVQERLSFYSEMIEDRIEEGLSEEEAVEAVGKVEEIAKQIESEISPKKVLVRERKLKTWETVLLIAGSPVWISLLIAAFAVALSLYVVMWALVICLWAIFAAFIGCAVGALVCGAAFILNGNTLSGIALLGAAAVLAGLAIFLFYASRLATKGCVNLTKRIVVTTETEVKE